MARYRHHRRKNHPPVNIVARIGLTAALLLVLLLLLTNAHSEAFWDFVIGIMALVAAGTALVSLIHYTAQRFRAQRAMAREYRFIATTNDMYALDPFTFETYVAWLYEQQGYTTKVTPKQKDGGIDVFLYHSLTDTRPCAAIQVKRYKPKSYVGRNEVDEFFGAYHDKAKQGIFVTTGVFSDWSRDRAKELGTTLVDGHALVRMAERYGIPPHLRAHFHSDR